MSRQYCKYHPLEAALWYNPQTHTAYCERCVDSSETRGGHGQAKCYLHSNELSYLGSANTAQPFWERLGAFFLYPLQKDSLIVMGLLVLFIVVVSAIGLRSLPILIVSVLGLLAYMTRYGFLIIEHSAEGRFEPPTLAETFSGSGFRILFQQVVVQIIFAVFITLVGLLKSGLFDAVASALVVLVWPASTMLLAIEGSIAVAVNPGAIWHLIRSIGWSYLLLYAFLFLLLGILTAVIEVFALEMSLQFFVPVFIVLALYLFMVSFHLMGYVIFQYQADIGFVAEDQLAREKRRSKIEPVDAISELMVKEGQYEKAVQVLTKYLNSNPNSLRHHEKLSRLLLALHDRDQAFAHGQFYLEKLHQLGDDARLYFSFCSYQEVDAKFKPEQPQICLALAEQFYQRGKFQQVCSLLANLHKSAPNFPEIPKAYLLMARSLLDGFQDKYKATQYLKFIQTKYPEFIQSSEVDSLLLQCAK